MKISRWFIVIMILVFVLFVFIEVKTPKSFNWSVKTYGHYDANPYGAKVVDSLLAKSVRSGYKVKPGSITEAYENDVDTNSAVLLVGNQFKYYGSEYQLLDLLSRGQTVFLFTDDDLPVELQSELNICLRYYSLLYCSNDVIDLNHPHTLLFKWKEDSVYDEADYKFRTFDPHLSIILPERYSSSVYNSSVYDNYDYDVYNYEYHGYYYDDEEEDEEDEEDEEAENEGSYSKLLLTDMNECVVASCGYEGGKLVLVSYPSLFTNYNILEDGGAPLLMRILSQADGKPIVRYDNTISENMNNYGQSQSPLRVFINNKSLRWAVYLALAAIVISLLFTARRKQRVIPLVERPKNQTIEMIKHIGLLYYRNHDNAILVSDKYRQLVFELQRKKFIYLEDDGVDVDSLQTLAEMAEIDREKLNSVLARIKEIDKDDAITVADKEAKRLIDVMDKILNKM